jgi:hypothetical protein
MKKKIFIIMIAFLATNAIAETITDTVHSISYGKAGEDHLVYLTNGRVLFFELGEVLPKVGALIEADLNDDNQVNSFSALPSQSLPLIENVPLKENSEKATVLSSYEAASAVFNGMNQSWKNKTECTDRAHVWSYEEWRRRGLISRKIFLFFTEAYIRRYNFNWWFHVSPYTLAKSENSVVEYVIDRRYSSMPITMTTWKNIFVKSGMSCLVTTYRHYQANKYSSQHCFAVKSNMYNRLPYHIRMEEDTGRVQSRFSMDEVNFSYRAFERRAVNFEN